MVFVGNKNLGNTGLYVHVCTPYTHDYVCISMYLSIDLSNTFARTCPIPAQTAGHSLPSPTLYLQFPFQHGKPWLPLLSMCPLVCSVPCVCTHAVGCEGHHLRSAPPTPTHSVNARSWPCRFLSLKPGGASELPKAPSSVITPSGRTVPLRSKVFLLSGQQLVWT